MSKQTTGIGNFKGLLHYIMVLGKYFYSLIIVFSLISNDDTGEFSRLCGWRDVGEGDVKIFLAHLIAMGLVWKETSTSTGIMEKL